MKNGFLILLCMPGIFSGAQTLLTHNTDQSVWNNLSGACNTTGPGTIEDNSFLRFFDTDDFNAQDSAFFVAIEFGVHTTSGGAYDLIGRVYRLDGIFEFANMALLSVDTAAIYPDSTLYIMRIPFDTGYVLPGDTAVVEVFAPLNSSVLFDPGSNPYPETGLSYIAANACGFFEPIDYATIGYPTTHLLLNLWVNHKPTMNNFSQSAFKDNITDFQKSDFTAAFTDFDSDTLNLLRVEILPVNGDLNLAGFPVNVGDTIWSDELNQLTYTPDPGYVGTDSYSVRVRDGFHWSNSLAVSTISVLDWQVGLDDFIGSQIQIFPNPTSSVVKVYVNELILEKILFDASGMQLPLASDNSESLDLSSYQPGTYFLLIKTTSGIFVHEIIRL